MRITRKLTAFSERDLTLLLRCEPASRQGKPCSMITPEEIVGEEWPMLRRLIEVNYFANREIPSGEQIRFGFSNSGRPIC